MYSNRKTKCHPRKDGDLVYNYLIYNVYCVWIPSYEGMTKTDISFCVNYIF